MLAPTYTRRQKPDDSGRVSGRTVVIADPPPSATSNSFRLSFRNSGTCFHRSASQRETLCDPSVPPRTAHIYLYIGIIYIYIYIVKFLLENEKFSEYLRARERSTCVQRDVQPVYTRIASQGTSILNRRVRKQ